MDQKVVPAGRSWWRNLREPAKVLSKSGSRRVGQQLWPAVGGVVGDFSGGTN